MTGDIGLYLSALILIFGALCCLACAVCAWFGDRGKAKTAALGRCKGCGRTVYQSAFYYADYGPFHDSCYKRFRGIETAPYKLEPDYLADCEWPEGASPTPWGRTE